MMRVGMPFIGADMMGMSLVTGRSLMGLSYIVLAKLLPQIRSPVNRELVLMQLLVDATGCHQIS